jgi:hypothetical protein
MGTTRISKFESGPATTFYLEADRVSQNVTGNYTTIHIYLRAVNGPGALSSSHFDNSGAQYGGADGYGMPAAHGPVAPFLPSGVPNGGQRWHDGPWAINVGHNADGTGPGGGITLRMQTRYSGHDVDTVANFNDFPTIPRASTPSLTVNPVDAGASTTINTNRASTGFTHDIYYAFGSIGWTLIASGVGASTSWTPPLSLLNQIPNAPTGVGSILCYTYSGGTLIGSKTVNFTLSTPSSVIPTWTSVATSEDNADVATYVGAYVQNVSKLDYAITGAAGVYGSSIYLQRFSAAGQTVDGASGTTPLPINSSGTVPVTWLIQDSRGKQKSQTSNITVLPYVTPVISSCTVQRALSDGTPDPDEGTYLRVDATAAVQSLMNTTQRNIIQLKIRTRPLGSGTAWTDPSTLKATLSPGGITYNSFTTVAGPYAVDQSYEVRVEALDRFNLSSFQTSVAVGAVFMHWDEDGLGLGKYRENGMLDVNGDIFQSNARVVDSNDLWYRRALLPGGYRGESNPNVTLLSDGSTVSNVPWVGTYDQTGSRVVNLAKTAAGGYAITGQSGEEGYGRWIRLPLSAGWQNYGEEVGDQAWAEASMVRLPSGIVQLSGLIRGGTVTSGTVIATLPVGYRPDSNMIFLTSNGDVIRGLAVKSNGQISAEAGWTSTYISLDQIVFPAAGVATWTDVGSGGSSYANGWTAFNTATWGQPGYWKDPYGFVWLRGVVGGGTTATDNTNMIALPASHRADLEQHMVTVSSNVYGLVGAKTTDGVNWKTGTSSTWISLCGVTIRTSDAVTQNVWWGPAETGMYNAPLQNGWTYTGAFTIPSFAHREDGLVIAAGLARSGTSGTYIMRLHEDTIPYRHRLTMTGANLATARVDIKGRNEQGLSPGRIQHVSGSNSWVTLDGLKWVPGGI